MTSLQPSFCFSDRRETRQSGFTLLELLLVIGVTAVLFLGITQIMRGWVNGETSTSAGSHLQRASALMQRHIENNWAILTDTNDALNDGRAEWIDLKTSFQNAGLLNGNQLRSPLGVPLAISFLKVGTISRGVIYALTPVSQKQALDAARQSGNVGGTLSNFPNNTNAYGAFGQWRVPAGQLMPGGAALPCTPGATTSCLVAVVSFNSTTLCGSYLYRTTQAACASANTMQTGLNMNNHDISNAKDVSTADLNIANTAALGDTTVNGTTTLNGPATAASGLNVTAGGMTVSGTANFANNVTVVGDVTAPNVNAVNVQSDNILANEIKAANLNMPNGKLAVDESIAVNGNVSVAGGEVLAASVNAGQIDASAGNITTGTVTIQNQMVINGQVRVTGGALAADHLVAEHCTIVNGESFGNCP